MSSSKGPEVLSWRRGESTPSRGGRGRGRGGRGRGIGDGGPGRPESTGRRRGAPKHAEPSPATGSSIPTSDVPQRLKPVAEDKARRKSPPDSINHRVNGTPPRTSSKAVAGGLPIPKPNTGGGSTTNGTEAPSPVTSEGVTKRGGSRKQSSRQSHRRSKSGALQKPTPIIVLDTDKSIISVTGSPSTPAKDLPPHLTANASEAPGPSTSSAELEQIIEHVPSEQNALSTPSVFDGHIDWAQDDDDEELPDLDDWGITTAKPTEESFSDTASRHTAESGSAPTIESSSPGQVHAEINDGVDGGEIKPSHPHPIPQLETPQVSERRRTRGRDRDRGTSRSKGAATPSERNSSTAQETNDYEVPKLPNGQKKSLIDRIGPNPLLSLPSPVPTTDGSPPKSPNLPYHPSLPAKPSVSPFASNFSPNSLSLKPMSDWRSSASRSRSPSKEPPAERQTSTLDSIHAPASVRAATPVANGDLGVEKAGNAEVIAPSPSADVALNVQSLFQGSQRPQFIDDKAKSSTKSPPHRPRRDRSPPRSHRGPRNHPAFQPHGSGPGSSSRPSRSRHTTAARPVISVDALQRISRSLKGSPTPPRHSSPAAHNIPVAAAAAE